MANNFNPKPLPTYNVVLSNEIIELIELLAENAHDIWAFNRINEGWIYGPERCDKLRHHPCLVPYSQLSETEKDVDRNTVIGTIRAVHALGFIISKI